MIDATELRTRAATFAASFPYGARPCYAGIGKFSVYVAREYRGRGAGRAVLAALMPLPAPACTSSPAACFRRTLQAEPF